MKMFIDYLQKNEDKFIETLKEMVELESPSRNKVLTDKFCDYLEKLFGKLAKVSRIKQDEVADFLKIEYGVGDKQVMVIGHMDTVWDEGEIQERPFVVDNENDKIYGPGLYDMKFGLTQIYYCLKALKDNNVHLGYKVVVFINSDEEIGSIYSRKLIEAEAVKSSAVLVLEPPQTKKLKTGRKGVERFHVIVEGKSSHAGAAHQKGVSAIEELAEEIVKLEGLTDYEKGVTVNVGIMQGGGKVNVVPDYAEAYVDVRVVTKNQAEYYKNLILNLKPHNPHAKLTITGGLQRPPMERTEGNVGLFRIAEEVAKEINLKVEETTGGGCSDGNFTSALGIPTLDGLGALGDGAHAKHEHILKSDAIIRTQLVLGMLLKLSDKIKEEDK